MMRAERGVETSISALTNPRRGGHGMARSTLSDLLGRESRFGRLTVIGEAPQTGAHRRARCICDCGTEKDVLIGSLKGGLTASCGCLRREETGKAAAARAVHGECHKTPEHRSWQAMLARCLNPSHEAYANYGGRGITVCDRWRVYEGFLADMGRRPTLAHTLERDDNDGHYEPGNCRWATKTEQLRNRRNNRVIEYRGRTICLAEAAELAGISPELMRWRIKRGWSPEKAIETPVR